MLVFKHLVNIIFDLSLKILSEFDTIRAGHRSGGCRGRSAALTIAADAGTGGIRNIARPRPGFIACRACRGRAPRQAGAPLNASTRVDVMGSGMDGMVRLETARLRMRPVQPRDLDSLTALNGDPNKMKYIGPPLSRHQVQEALDWMIAEWHRIGYGWFSVFEKSSRTFVGQVGLQCFEYDPRSAETELAFVIKKSAWGRGYAREAAGEVLRFGFRAAPV